MDRCSTVVLSDLNNDNVGNVANDDNISDGVVVADSGVEVTSTVSSVNEQITQLCILYDSANWLQNILVNLTYDTMFIDVNMLTQQDLSVADPVISINDELFDKFVEDVQPAMELIVITNLLTESHCSRLQPKFTVIRYVEAATATLEVYVEMLRMRGWTSMYLAELAYQYYTKQPGDSKYIFPGLSVQECRRLISAHTGVMELDEMIAKGKSEEVFYTALCEKMIAEGEKCGDFTIAAFPRHIMANYAKSRNLLVAMPEARDSMFGFAVFGETAEGKATSRGVNLMT
jgi:hypothetical protein